MGWTAIDPYRSVHYATDRDAPRRSRGSSEPGRRPPFVPIAPVIVLLIVLVSSFPAGLVLLPLMVFGLVMVSAASQGARHRRWDQRGTRADWPTPSARPQQSNSVRPPAPAPAQTVSTATAPTAPIPAAGAIVQPAAGAWPNRDPAVRSPFAELAFWDAEPDSERRAEPAPLTPPAWDPLGVAPFAWDLPDPPPLNTPRRHRRPHLGVAKLITGGVLLAAMLATAGDFAGWWPLDWAAAGASVLAVLAIAMFGGSLRQRVRR